MVVVRPPRAAALLLPALLLAGCGSLVLPGSGEADLGAFVPTAQDPDPSTRIDGVVVTKHTSVHVTGGERVAYEQAPPAGGAHDQVWATCTGTVYPEAIRTENAVHSLEHGAVWVTWNPELADAATVEAIGARVSGQPYLLASPYPGQPTAVSVQAWGHQLRLDSADDPRLDQFVTALRQNPSTNPEPGASCDTASVSLFDPDDPPPFDASDPGPGATRQN